MKGKRYTTEQKIRILREADQAGSTIVGVCQEHAISEQTFHRWKRVLSRRRHLSLRSIWHDGARPSQAAQGAAKGERPVKAHAGRRDAR